MNVKKMLWSVAALALAATLAAISAPNVAHSVVSALVTVGNSPSQPVPTVATDAQTAFVASKFCYYPGGSDSCRIDPLYSVPAGKTAVIESASGVCVLNAGTTMREFQLYYSGPGGGGGQLSFPPSPGIASPSLGGAVVSTTAQNLKSYAAGGASGTSLIFTGWSSDSQPAYYYCAFTVSGYLVSTP